MFDLILPILLHGKDFVMAIPWLSILLGALTCTVAWQRYRISQIGRKTKNQDELFRIVTENAADMIALVDVKGRRLYNSPAYKRVLGYTAAELGETSAFEQIHPDDKFKVLEAARGARDTGLGTRLEYRIRHKDGSWRVLESQASCIRDHNGEIAKLVIVNRDITERKRAEEQVAHNLLHDALTGLANRRLFLDRLDRRFLRTRRGSDYCYAVLLINIDHFKVLNNSFGPAAGDQVLAEVARRIAACVRQQDTLARGDGSHLLAEPMVSRIGGDEFTLLLDGVNDPSDAMRVARRILGVAAEPLFIDSREVRVTLSIGIALATSLHERSEEVLSEADVAMRRAKSLGGSRCELFDEAMHASAVGRLKLEADLRTAMTERQFRVFYQPILHLRSLRVMSFEALLRWQHPTQGLISPYRFIEAAEDTGLLVAIGHWLTLQACRQLREWEISRVSGEPLNLTVNVSERQFADARLVSHIQDALKETGIDPARLQLEMTESVVAAEPRLTITVLSHLKHMGIGVILDDFGVGSASLSGLRRFPVDALKIDRSLIHEMQSDRTAADMVEVIITLAQKMNIRAIAEGIETARQAERLLALGCELGQGYYFSQPLDAKAALEFLKQPVAKTASASGD
jgi:diguanylate cyclase (GGDEF)-like protein/PAS domain S-box-containing protein